MWVKHHKSNAFSFCVLISFSILVLVAGAPQEIKCPIQSLYQLGDSISDTGNLFRIIDSAASHLPYGETFPEYPTGRWSDGRLIIDYIAMALGLPLLNPYLDKTASFDNGVNFAVAGATALNTSFYLEKGITVLHVPSLKIQQRQFRTYLNSTCSTPIDCAHELSKSLVFVGEIGYNDIALPLLQGLSIQEIRTYIPSVAQAIINTTSEVIKVGASQVVVPGVFPLGCFPAILSASASNDSTQYDDLGCLKSVNNLVTFLNNQVQEALDSLRKKFSNVVILHADYYNAFRSILRSASILGFDTKTLFEPCCGVANNTESCGSPGEPVCPNPNIYVHWDSFHLTQEAYRRISEIIIKDLKIKCTHPKYQSKTLIGYI